MTSVSIEATRSKYLDVLKMGGGLDFVIIKLATSLIISFNCFLKVAPNSISYFIFTSFQNCGN